MAKAFDNTEEQEKTGSDEVKRISNSPTPVLNNFSRDLMELAKEGKLDPVIGMDSQIQEVIEILNKRKKNNPILIGESGVGKSCLIEGLAIKIVKREAPRWLWDKRIVDFNVASIISGTKYRGQFEERMSAIIEEIRRSDDLIVFMDEIHTLIGAGAAAGGLDASNMLKPALSRGEIRCIGATTPQEFKKTIENDAALDRRFQKVIIPIPKKQVVNEILQQVRVKYQDYHGVIFSNEVINDIIELSDRYIPYKNFPDKAIDIMDEIGSNLKLNGFPVPSIIQELELKLKFAAEAKQHASKTQQYEQAAKFRDEERDMKSKLIEQHELWENQKKSEKIQVSRENVTYIISRHTGIPVNKLTKSEFEKLRNLEETLKQRLIGQDHVVKKIAQAIKRTKLGTSNPDKPFSALCLGPTGTGKTLLAKLLSELLFTEEGAFMRIDMSEYMEKQDVNKLIGSAPGYVGYEEKGRLTEKIKMNPYTLILLDEVEKAHPLVWNVMLQVLDDGILTDSQGKTVNFKNCIIIMTSNIGSDKIVHNSIGFSKANENADKTVEDKVMQELEKNNFFKVEFLNRIDEKIVFYPLSKEDCKLIVELELEYLKSRLLKKNINISFKGLVSDFILRKGFSEKYGARQLKRTIAIEIENPLSDIILEYENDPKKKYVIDVDEKKDSIKINAVTKK